MKIPKILQILSNKIDNKNGKAIIVGGSVRDHFLKLPLKDYDIEVYGLEKIEVLEGILSEYGSVNLVGKSFGVLKFIYEEEEYDFSFPRKEKKVGVGHREFDISINGELSYKDAAKRRDFTFNALGYEIENRRFLDPFGGLEDIKNYKIRHINDETFMEDPLRVYRAVQFSARFGYTLDDATFVLCRKMVEQMTLTSLPKERIYGEWKKFLLKSPKPSLGFEVMRSLGILERYFPELYALIGVPQSPIWHPEGDVWIHTMMTVDEMANALKQNNKKLNIEKKEQLKFLFAILCHDLGKATHTSLDDDGRIRSIGHEKAGIKPTETLLYRLTDEHNFIKSILPLVEHHLKPSQFYKGKATASAFRRLATKVNIEELVFVAKADFLGRRTEESLARVYDAGAWMLECAQKYKVKNKALEPLLQGRDLIVLGLKPSILFKEILDIVYAKQLKGSIESKDEALDFVKEKMKSFV